MEATDGPTRWLLKGLATLALSFAMLTLSAGTQPEQAHAVTDCGLTAPANITQSNDLHQAGAVVNYPGPTTSGTCNTITCVPSSGSFFSLGTTMVTCSATTSPVVRASFTIRINDTQFPTLLLPGGPFVSPTAPGQNSAAVDFPDPVGTDNGPGVLSVCDRLSGSLFPIGTTTVHCIARDGAGLVTTGSFDVIVQDKEAPTLTVPPPKTAKAKKGKRRVNVAYGPVTVRDNSGADLAAKCSNPSGSAFPVGRTTVTCFASDAAGNVGTASFPVIVRKKKA